MRLFYSLVICAFITLGLTAMAFWLFSDLRFEAMVTVSSASFGMALLLCAIQLINEWLIERELRRADAEIADCRALEATPAEVLARNAEFLDKLERHEAGGEMFRQFHEDPANDPWNSPRYLP